MHRYNFICVDESEVDLSSIMYVFNGFSVGLVLYVQYHDIIVVVVVLVRGFP